MRKSRKSRKYKSGCVIIFTPKYQSRKSPAYDAKLCKGRYKIGSDNYIYKSTKIKNGIYRWIKVY